MSDRDLNVDDGQKNAVLATDFESGSRSNDGGCTHQQQKSFVLCQQTTFNSSSSSPFIPERICIGGSGSSICDQRVSLPSFSRQWLFRSGTCTWRRKLANPVFIIFERAALSTPSLQYLIFGGTTPWAEPRITSSLFRDHG